MGASVSGHIYTGCLPSAGLRVFVAVMYFIRVRCTHSSVDETNFIQVLFSFLLTSPLLNLPFSLPHSWAGGSGVHIVCCKAPFPLIAEADYSYCLIDLNKSDLSICRKYQQRFCFSLTDHFSSVLNLQSKKFNSSDKLLR
jgi:hypothetical protein